MDHANPEDAQRLVLGDALSLVGDPLGALVAVQAKLAEIAVDDPRRDGLLGESHDLIRRHEERWFGDLAPTMRRENRVDYEWRLGFLDAVTLRTTNQRFHRELTRSPAAQFLRRLRIDLRDLTPSQTVKDGWIAELHAPHLEEFEYLPHRTTGDIMKLVAEKGKSWPKLRSLVLWFGGNGLAQRFFTPLIEGKALPWLTHLGIKEMPWGNPGLEQLANDSPLFKRLRSLDLSFGVIDTMSKFERFAHLEKLDLRHNVFHSERAAEIKAYFGDRVAIENQYYRPDHPAKVQHFNEVMRRVLAERAGDEAWTSEFRPSPYDPSGIVEKELAVPEAIPYLLEHLRLEDERKPWILEAFRKLGPAAGPAVSNALVLRRASYEVAFIDPERARGLGYDRERGIRSPVCGRLRDTPSLLMRHLSELLVDEDPEVVLFALGGTGVSDQSYLDYVARDTPELVPKHLVRMHLAHSDARIREAAASLLAMMHLPEDADLVVKHRTTSVETYPYASWLGSHPRSDRMILRDDVDIRMDNLFHVVRRRRCAGLANDLDALRPRLVAALEKTYATTSDREVAHRFAAETIDELRLDDLASRAQPVNRRVPPLDEADEQWIAGNADDSILHDDGAFGHYARALWADPTCAHAAFQMAWTERAYGSFIAPERIAWLRELGVAPDLLLDLAVRPKRIPPGYGPHRTKPSDESNPARATILLEAGVPGVAANLFPWKSNEQLAARAAATAHVVRVRAGTKRR